MYDKQKSQALLKTIHDLAKQRGIELPPLDPLPEQQPVYERFLRLNGFNPDQVDRVIEMERLPEEKRAAIHAMLMQALINQSKMSNDELKGILYMVQMIFSEHRASGLVRTIATPLIKIAKKKVSTFGQPFSLGVFPMRWFNGAANVFESTPICLIAHGCFDLIEAFVTLFLANQKDAEYAVLNTRQALEHYVDTGEAKKPEYALGQGLVDFGSTFGSALVTSAEQFLIGHELGHIALGHLKTGSRAMCPLTIANTTTKKIEMAKPAHFDEHCADIWGMSLLLESASKEKEDELPIACAGASIFMGLALLIETVASFRKKEIEDTHPPAAERLYLIDLALELTGNHEKAFVARRFREFTESVGTKYPGFEMPPMLSRPLNKTAASVFEHLGFDLSKAPYITNFQ
jgi:hypothetical protein